MSLKKNQTAKPVNKKAALRASGAESGKPSGKAVIKPLLQPIRKPTRPHVKPLSLTREIFDAAGVGVYLARQGRYVAASPVYEMLTGYASGDLAGKKITDFLHPEDRQHVRNSRKKQNHRPDEYRFIAKDGRVIRLLEKTASIVHQGTKAMLGTVLDMSSYQEKEDAFGCKEETIGFRGVSRDITWRKRIEEDLLKSEQRYRTILEEIEEGYGELDLTGTWTFVNEAGAKNIGYTPEEMIGKNYREVTDETSAQKMFELFSTLYKTGQSFKGQEVEYISKQGNRRVNEISGALVRDDQGRPIGFRGLSRDITQRKWAEDALLQSEAKYFSIIEGIGDAYFETDITGVMTFINDRVCKDLGYTREELLRMSNRDIQDDASAQETYAIFNEVYETGHPVKEFQYKVRRKDGSPAVFELSISLMRDAEGKPIGFRGLSRDITVRKRMENALRASEERARTIITTIPDPYFENDLHGKFTYINTAFKNLSGYSPEEMPDLNFRVFMDRASADRVSVLYDTVYKTGLPMKNVELSVITKGGEKRLVDLSVSLIRDSQGSPSGFHGIMRDITEKRKAEELIRQSEQSLREYSETLELRVRERTAELEKSKVAAEAASRAKSDFMASMSHEFQTPLNAVIGFTKVLQDRMFGELNEKQEEFVRYIGEAGESLSRIVTEILDATHVSSGSTKLNVSSISIVDALTKTNRLLAMQMEEKNQILTVDVDLDADVAVEADEQKIQQVFFHVLSNAVKYNATGGKIDVRDNQSKP